MPEPVAFENFRHNVKTLLASNEKTITWLADASGIARPSLSQILNAHERVTLDRAEKIAQAFGMTLAALVGEKFEEPVAARSA